MITVQLVNLPDVPNWWGRAWPVLHKALAKRKVLERYPEWRMRQECISGNAQLWMIWKDNKITGSMMTRIQTYPGGEKFLEVFALAGWKLTLWMDKAYDAIRSFAKAYSCTSISSHGRAGWSRLAKRKADEEDVTIDHVVMINI